MERGTDLLLVEVKSAQTPSGQALASFERFQEILAGKQAPRIADRLVVYAGNETQLRSQGTILSWRDLDTYDWEGNGSRVASTMPPPAALTTAAPSDTP